MLECKVERAGDALLLRAGGELLPPMAYVTYNPAMGRYAPFGREGARLFSATLYMGDRGINSQSGIRPFRPGFWKAGGEYDFSAAEEDFTRIVEAVPGALIFPRIHFDVPLWWERENPGEVARDPRGMPLRQSFASGVWLDGCRRALERYYGWLARSGLEDHTVGCHVAAGGTEEWFYHQTYPGQLSDYSEVNRAAFARWLRVKYSGDLGALNAAWRTGLKSFEEASAPPPAARRYALRGEARDPLLEAHAVDWAEYHSLCVAEAVVALCGQVKRITGGRHLAGAFYGYVMELTSPDCAHHALRRVLESPDVDFLASPLSYVRSRAAGLDWPTTAPVESVTAHGKMWFVEADVRTCLTRYMKETMPYAAPEGNRNYEAAVWRGPDTAALSLGAMGKAFASALTHNTALWWFDMWAGWYDCPEFMEFIGKARAIHGEAMLAGGSAAAEIAVVVDEASYSLFRPESDAMRRATLDQRCELGFLGAPYHSYLMSDLPVIPAERYRLVIFLNAARLAKKDAEEIDRRFKRDGRTLLWVGLAREPGEGLTGFAGSPSVEEGDPAQYALRRDGEGRVRLALLRREGYFAALSAEPCVDAGALRELALLAGAHVYCHTGDVVYANRDFVAVHAASGGAKRVYFPAASDGEALFGPADNFRGKLFHDFCMEPGDTAMWRIRPAASPQ